MFALATICFVVCHAGPADHFATFTEHLSDVEILASGPALKKFRDRGIEVTVPFSLDHLTAEAEDQLAEHIADRCSDANAVVTDVGHPFDVKVQRALALRASHVRRLAYYDNPEPYVPGGYSEVAAKVMREAGEVLFANANLVEEMDLEQPKVAIGYYPCKAAEKIKQLREAKQPQEPKVWGYFGGNNDEYFTKALPAFLAILEAADLKDLVVLLQQHPGAKAQNRDGKMIGNNPQIILSEFTTDELQTRIDGAFYYQTSMAPQFVLAGIPTVQIGHETYGDILVKNHLIPSVTTAEQLSAIFEEQDIPPEVIYEGLGIRENWAQNLRDCLLK